MLLSPKAVFSVCTNINATKESLSRKKVFEQKVEAVNHTAQRAGVDLLCDDDDDDVPLKKWWFAVRQKSRYQQEREIFSSSCSRK